MISRFIAPPYALEYQKNHCSPFSVKPWELSLHDDNNHFGNCPCPSPKGLHRRTGHKCHRMDGGSKVYTGKTRSRDHGHMGTLLRACRLSPSQCRRFVPQSIALSWVATSMAVSTISSLPFEIAQIMPLQAALSPCVVILPMFLCASRRARLNAFP